MRWPWLWLGAGLVLIVTLPWLIISHEAPPLVYRNSPFPVLRSPVHPGEEVSMLVDRCNQTDHTLAYTFARLLVPAEPGRVSIAMLPASSLMPPGPACEQVESQLNVLPLTAPPGRYYLDAVSVVAGTWRTFSIPWRSEIFEVAAP